MSARVSQHLGFCLTNDRELPSMAQVKFSGRRRSARRNGTCKKTPCEGKTTTGGTRCARKSHPTSTVSQGTSEAKFAASPGYISLTQRKIPALRCFAKSERTIFSKKENRHLQKWWGRGDSNSHAFQHMILSHARLPISTLPLCSRGRSADTKPVAVHDSTGLAAEGILALSS